MEPLDWVTRLDGQRIKHLPEITRMDEYYEGEQPLKYMAPALERELGDRITQLVINWARVGVDAYENRLDVEGFRLPDEDDADAEMWRIWQDNDLDEVSQQAHLESLITGRAYAIVGPNEAEPATPVITVEHPSQVITYQDPRTRRVLWGLKRWRDDEDPTHALEHAALYGVDATWYYTMDKTGWELTERVDHERGICPVVPLINRGRILRPLGTSELADVIPIADAVNKMATDMMVSGEFHAMPRRVWFGVAEDDFVDDHGNQTSVWSRVAGREWALEQRRGEVDVEQFRETDLAVFHNSIRLLAQTAAQVMALPPHYMSFSTDNPASADAIRSSEAQLVKRVERKQRILGGGWETVMRIARHIATGDDDPSMRRLETIWRDAATPTVAAKADAAVKLFAAGISTLRQTREDVGYTAGQIARMERDDDEARQRDPLAEIAQGFADRTVTSGDTNAGSADTPIDDRVDDTTPDS